MASKQDASHSAMWDDSALVDSWNDAVEEYKKYHSLEAHGENVNEVLKAAENGENDIPTTIFEKEGGAQIIDDPQAKQDALEGTVDHDAQLSKNHHEVNGQTRDQAPGSDKILPALPQHLIGQVHDDSLKNLLMSWYYAGYYTGLYEGQQQPKAGTDAKPEA